MVSEAMTVKGTVEKNSKDVLVVGAGPAGIAAAQALSKSGAKVVLIDRHSKPGGKACAGGLTAQAWQPAGIDPAHLPGWASRFDALVVKTKLGSASLKGQGPLMVTIDRQAWAAEKIASLRELGVEVHLGERLIGLDSTRAVTSRGKIPFGLVVAADGATSRIRKHLGLNTGLAMGAWQIRVSHASARKAGLEIERPAIWFEPALFGSGYAWTFPALNEVRIGCGASLRVLGRHGLKQAFGKMIARLGLDRKSGCIEAGTIGCGYNGYRFGRVFLAGDAAGLASPITGEGITQALISGQEVANEIIDSSYHSRIIAEFASRHRRTHDVLSRPAMRGSLYPLAPYLLRVPVIWKETLSRYIV